MNNIFDINTFDGVIFDLDGTLIDSMGVWNQIDIDFLGKRGLKVPDDYLEKITPMGYEAAADYTIERFGFNETRDDLVKEWYSMAIDAYSNHVKLKNGVKEYLEFLKQNGKVMSVATASDRELVIPVLTNNKVLEYFHNITTVREVKRGKGYPDIYNEAAKKMNINSEKCIVFEDILAGLKGAKAGNYRTVGVFDKLSRESEELLMENSDKFIYDFREMIN